MRSKFTRSPNLQRKPATCKKKPKPLPFQAPIILPYNLVFAPAWFISLGAAGGYTHFGIFTATQDFPNIWRVRTNYEPSVPPGIPGATGSIWFWYFPELNTFHFSAWMSEPGFPAHDREFDLVAPYTFGPNFNFLIPVQPNPTLQWGTFGCIGHL